MKYFMFILFSFFVLLETSKAYYIPVKISIDLLEKKSLKNSDYVFLGELENIDTINLTLQFKVLEIFKGDFNKENVTIKWEEHTPVYFYDKTLWIVYANNYNDSTYILNKHGLTRSILHPEVILSVYNVPSSLDSSSNIDDINKFIHERIEFNDIPLKHWLNELELLRHYKVSKTENEEIDRGNYKTYFIFSIILNIIVLILLVYILLNIKDKTIG